LSREKMRKNAEEIAAVGVDNLLDIGDAATRNMQQGEKLKDKFEASETYTSEKAAQQTSEKNQLRQVRS